MLCSAPPKTIPSFSQPTIYPILNHILYQELTTAEQQELTDLQNVDMGDEECNLDDFWEWNIFRNFINS